MSESKKCDMPQLTKSEIAEFSEIFYKANNAKIIEIQRILHAQGQCNHDLANILSTFCAAFLIDMVDFISKNTDKEKELVFVDFFTRLSKYYPDIDINLIDITSTQSLH